VTQVACLALTAAMALLTLVNTPFPELAPLQNLPTLAIVAIFAVALRHWPMPTSAVVCAACFLLLHTLGGRYIYSFVPYDRWAASLGLPEPTTALGLARNSYDRVVHFSFGVLLVHPVATALLRHGGAGRRLSLYIAVQFVFAGSALYEIFEWLLTFMMAGAADAYNGQQGDVWDAQKDMACAGIGAIGAVAALALRPARRGSNERLTASS
jgi:putative membrane protein